MICPFCGHSTDEFCEECEGPCCVDCQDDEGRCPDCAEDEDG